MHSMFCGKVLSGIERGGMRRVCGRLSHQHGLRARRKYLHGMCSRNIFGSCYGERLL